VEGLSQDAILGVNFLENSQAVLDFRLKRMSLLDGAVSIPLVTDIDRRRMVRTLKRLRIPANSEAIFRASVPRDIPFHTGITETLPKTLN